VTTLREGDPAAEILGCAALLIVGASLVVATAPHATVHL